MTHDKQKAPAYQWYPKDYDTDEAVKLMTYEQEGIYRRLLDHQALHGSIPEDPQQIALLVPKVPRARFVKLWDGMAAKFPAVSDGRRANRRLARSQIEYADYLRGKSDNGRKGAEARWQKHSDTNGERIGEPMPNRWPATASATAEQERSRALGRGSVLDGALPRDHKHHAVCDPSYSRCVPYAVHDKLTNLLAPKHQGDRTAAKAELQAWYATVWASLPADFVMGEAFRFWQARFDAAFASKDTAAAKPNEPKSTVPSADRTAQYLARQRQA